MYSGGRMKIYVGNLSRDTTEKDLQKAFEAFGKVISADINVNEETGLSNGFGYVEMAKEKEAKAAIKEMNGKKLKKQEIEVKEARSLKTEKPSSGVPKREGRRRF